MSWSFAFSGKRDKRNMTFCFSGGLGWKTEPETGGFRMLINGKDPIVFDVTTNPAIWLSSDKSIELIYLPTWSSSLDSAGFFFVNFLGPYELEGTNVKISVSSLGQGSKRWFAVDSEQNILKRLEALRAASN